jgi:hypothetical protein
MLKFDIWMVKTKILQMPWSIIKDKENLMDFR